MDFFTNKETEEEKKARRESFEEMLKQQRPVPGILADDDDGTLYIFSIHYVHNIRYHKKSNGKYIITYTTSLGKSLMYPAEFTSEDEVWTIHMQLCSIMAFCDPEVTFEEWQKLFPGYKYEIIKWVR